MSEVDSNQSLAQVKSCLRALENDPNDTDSIKKLAEFSREKPSTRSTLSEPEALKILINVVEQNSTKQEPNGGLDAAIRCVANACVESSEAREKLASNHGLAWVKPILESGDRIIRVLASKVLYNICFETEAVHKQCYRDGVHFELMKFCVLADPEDWKATEESGLSYALELLFLITSQKSEIEPILANPLSEETLTELLELPSRGGLDIDEFRYTTETALAFLRDGSVSKQIIRQHLFDKVWRLLDLTTEIIHPSSNLDAQSTELAEDAELVKPYEQHLLWVLSDISADPDFVAAYPVDGAVVQKCTAIIQDQGLKSYAHVSASCQVLGNVLHRSEVDPILHLVEQERLQLALFARILSSEGGALGDDMMHSAAGLLVHLTRPGPRARTEIADSDACRTALEKLIHHSVQQLSLDGAKLVRSLGRECPEVQHGYHDLAIEAMQVASKAQQKPAETFTFEDVGRFFGNRVQLANSSTDSP